MNRLALIALLAVVVWYFWWRLRRRSEATRVVVRNRKPAEPAPSALTLEKDPVTGVYRPPKR